MTEQADMGKLLTELEKTNRRQLFYSRIQCFFSVAAALFCAGVFFSLSSILPQIGSLSAQLETVLGNLETITAQLSKLDFEQIVHSAEGDFKLMVENVDSLVSASQTGINETMQKLNAIDFNKLNRAISDFSAVVQKLSSFLNVFN